MVRNAFLSGKNWHRGEPGYYPLLFPTVPAGIGQWTIQLLRRHTEITYLRGTLVSSFPFFFVFSRRRRRVPDPAHEWMTNECVLETCFDSGDNKDPLRRYGSAATVAIVSTPASYLPPAWANILKIFNGPDTDSGSGIPKLDERVLFDSRLSVPSFPQSFPLLLAPLKSSNCNDPLYAIFTISRSSSLWKFSHFHRACNLLTHYEEEEKFDKIYRSLIV